MKNKVKKLLNKNVSIEVAACIGLSAALLVLGIFCLIKTPFKSYSYVDLNNNYGQSRKCYKEDESLVCIIKKEVKQYYEN